MGAHLGISSQQVCRIEQGKRKASRPVEKLFRLLVTHPDLLPRATIRRRLTIDATFTAPDRCRLCKRLVGPGHEETVLVDGLCSKCREEARGSRE